MSNTIGRVDFTATLDGRNTPREAENIGRKAGAAAGEGYDRTWSQSFRDSLTKSGQQALRVWKARGEADGTAYGKAVGAKFESYLAVARKNAMSLRMDPGFLDDFVRKYDDAGLAAGELQRQLVTLREEGELDARTFERVKSQVDAWAISQRNAAIDTNDTRDRVAALREELDLASDSYREHTAAIEANRERQKRADADLLKSTQALLAEFAAQDRESARAAAAAERLAVAQDRVTRANEQQEHGWRSLSHNTRQWTLIIAAVASGMQDISALGSAAGAGLVALGGGAVSGVAGIGGLAALLVTLNKEIDELPPNLRSAKAEFDRFTPVFGELREAVSAGALAEMGGTFDQLGRNLRSLTPELTTLGTSVGNVFDDLAEGTARGSEGLDEIRTALRLAGGNFEGLSAAAGTWAVALLRSFNRAQPMVEQMIGYIDELGNRLDAFSRSRGFDDWIARSSATFTDFGELLDATGRALNDLVTPQTVAQTQQFLDDLTAFMPALSDILGVLGAANPFGLIAQALNETGVALDPLLPALTELAGALSGLASDALPAVSFLLAQIAEVVAPVAEGAAAFIDALPPEVIQGIVAGLGGIALAFGAMKAGGAITGAIASIEGFTTAAAEATTVSGRLGNSLKANLGKAGLAGVAVGGAVALGAVIGDLVKDLSGLEDRSSTAARTATSLGDAIAQVNPDLTYMGQTVKGSTIAVDDLAAAMELAANSGGTQWGLAMNTAAGASDELRLGAEQVIQTLGAMDEELSTIASANLPAAQEQFRLLTEGMGLNEQQMYNILSGSMPQFKEALDQIALSSGQVATSEDLVAMALGNATGAADANTGALGAMGGAAGRTKVDVDSLADSIRGFSEQVYGSRDASRQYEAAIDDLSESLTTNGATLDITTEQGRANQAAVDDLAQAVLDNSAATLENTEDQRAARDVMEQGRQKLIEMLAQFGITGQAAEDYADELGLIPENVLTDVELQGIQAAEASIQNLIRRRTVVVQATFSQTGAWTPGVDRPMASGGVLNGPTRILAGEAGEEAIVPLNRPLSLVDESVRWLSAIAQGKTPAFASGGVVGGGRTLNIDPGAIVVQDISGDPRRTANETVQRIVERVVG